MVVERFGYLLLAAIRIRGVTTATAQLSCVCVCVCDLVDHVSVRSATYVKDGVCVSVVGTAVFPFFCSAPTMPLPSVARQLAFFP